MTYNVGDWIIAGAYWAGLLGGVMFIGQNIESLLLGMSLSMLWWLAWSFTCMLVSEYIDEN